MTAGEAYLEARDGRQRQLEACLGRVRPDGALLFLAANVPGPHKHRPGVAPLLRDALAQLDRAIGLAPLASGRDLLGPYHLAASRRPAEVVKRAALAIEAATPAGRLLDLDVYRPDGGQADRAALQLTPRACLVCAEPARECILLGRHSQPELLARVDALLAPWAAAPERLDPEALAASLPLGALGELDLTPKPGLVDRRDSGSHGDLSYTSMRASIELLPRYYDELLRCWRRGAPLADSIQAGVEAERRMTRAIHSNAHKGYIFLSGLLLMAACRCAGGPGLREAIAELARACAAQAGAVASHGAELRQRLGLGGVRAEAESGLPAVFEQGWPHYREALAAGWEPDQARFQLLAVLMQRVEDSTAVSRCGLDGLARLRRDGAELQGLLERQRDPEPRLAELNQDYQGSGLTMGGVADCLALTLALQAAVG